MGTKQSTGGSDLQAVDAPYVVESSGELRWVRRWLRRRREGAKEVGHQVTGLVDVAGNEGGVGSTGGDVAQWQWLAAGPNC